MYRVAVKDVRCASTKAKYLECLHSMRDASAANPILECREKMDLFLQCVQIHS